MVNKTKLVIAGAAVVAAVAAGYIFKNRSPKHEEIAKPTSVEFDASPRSVSCGFATKTAFLLSIVTNEGEKKVLVKEGDKVQIGSKEYTVEKTEYDRLLLVNASGSTYTEIDVAERSVTVQPAGDTGPTVYNNLGGVGLVSLTEVARYEDNENYLSRAAVTLTAGGRSKTFVVEQGNEVSVTSPNGKTTTTAKFVEGSNTEAVVEVSASGDGFSVGSTMQRVGEGETVSYGSGSVAAKIESVTDEYDQSSTPKADNCREYTVTLLSNRGNETMEFDLVEGQTRNIAGLTVTVEKVQYDDNPENRFVKLRVVSGNAESTVVLKNGELTVLEGNGEKTQLIPVDMRYIELPPPTLPSQ